MTSPESRARSLAVARTIMSQIGTNTIMCLGVPRDSIMFVNETIDSDPENGHLGGVTFKFTNCPKVDSGRVTVTLKGNDTYDVVIVNSRGRELYKSSDIYCDMLAGPHGVIEQITG